MTVNQVHASRRAQFRGDPWRAMDALPSPIRQALHEAVVDWCPLWVGWEYRKLLKAGADNATAVQSIVNYIAACDEHDIQRFSVRHHKRHGYVLPAVAAGASVQTYGLRA